MLSPLPTIQVAKVNAGHMNMSSIALSVVGNYLPHKLCSRRLGGALRIKSSFLSKALVYLLRPKEDFWIFGAKYSRRRAETYGLPDDRLWTALYSMLDGYLLS